MRIKEEFDSIKNLVLYCLQKYPETRSNDTILFIRCCETLGATTLKEAEKENLSIISVHKLRQVIQNKEGRFLPPEKVILNRRERQEQIRQYMTK